MTVADARPRRASAVSSWWQAARSRGGGRAGWAWLVVLAVVVWNLVVLRAVLVGVPYLDDSSMHEQMVRFATSQWRAGHLPLTTWFPYLGEGSPQFLHYQSLPAMLTGAVGVLTGPDIAFRWSLYLLLCTWPVSVYVAARRLGGGYAASAASAGVASFLVSTPGVGYETHAYVWIGFGVWTQLWAMWALPLAWGCSWRAIRDGRGYASAVFWTGLAVCCHFETGYLALSVLIVWPIVAGRPFWTHIRRAAVVLAGTLACCAWAIVPLLSQRAWAAVNEPLQGTPLVNGYGARQVLEWLVSGQMLDHGRLPVVTILAAVGFSVAWLAWGRDRDGRPLLIALAIGLLLAFGRTTFGSLIDVIPGSRDLFFRRFMMGAQLAAILLAGRGAGWLAIHAIRLLRPRVPDCPAEVWPALAVLAGVAVMVPAWVQLGGYDHRNATGVDAQRTADRSQGREVDRLIAIIKARGGGRTYAGMPSNWGADFTVGSVPVFKYLESRDVDEVGYTLRTASLMTVPEYDFDQANPSDYAIFAIRYLILPAGQPPSVAARKLAQAGSYALWTIPENRYITIGQTSSTIPANRTDIGQRTLSYLQSDLAAEHEYIAIAYDRPHHAGLPTDNPTPLPPSHTPTGTITRQQADLPDGTATATIHMDRPGVAVLSATYDPGWRATLNGHRIPTHMTAPATLAVNLPAGTDHLTFRYHGYADYPLLLALAAVTFAAFGAAPHVQRRRAAVPLAGDASAADDETLA